MPQAAIALSWVSPSGARSYQVDHFDLRGEMLTLFDEKCMKQEFTRNSFPAARLPVRVLLQNVRKCLGFVIALGLTSCAVVPSRPLTQEAIDQALSSPGFA